MSQQNHQTDDALREALSVLPPSVQQLIREGANPGPPGLDWAPPHPEGQVELAASTPGRECGNCKMFDPANILAHRDTRGICWGFGNEPTDPEQVCRAFYPDADWRKQHAAIHVAQEEEG